MEEELFDTNSTMATSKLLLAGGSIMPHLEKLLVSHHEFNEICNRLVLAIHPGDVVVLGFIGTFTVPIFGMLFGQKTNGYMYQFGSHISQAAKLAILVYLFDCFVVILTTLGYSFTTLNTLSKGFAKILYILWLGQRLSVFKRYLLGRAFLKNPNQLGRASTIDRLLDGVLFMMISLFVLDVLDVGVASIFAVGSAGTLVIGLASQNVATMFVNGLVLTTSDRISEGDYITLGSGNSGQVQKIGWFQTTIRHYNELCEIIPNSELGMQRVTNLSRVRKCQVKQSLRFRYEDVDKLDKITMDILDEIKNACPECITDGSRPFRAYWLNFKEDHLRVVVDTHFELPPMGEVYQKNRHECLKAIMRAVKKNDVELVTTFYPNGIN